MRAKALSDGTYSAVKAYALKGSLIPRPSLETLAEAKDLEDLVNRLKATAYSEAIGRAKRPYSAERLEGAFREHLVDVHYSLMSVTPGGHLLSAYYTKHLVWDLKNVFKGKVMGKSYEEISAHLNLYAEELIRRRDLVVRALTAKDLDEAANLLKDTEFASDIAKAMTMYKSKNEALIFDLYLDRAFYRALNEALKGLKDLELLKEETKRYNGSFARAAKNTRSMITIDIDGYNVTSMLRAKLWDFAESEVRELIVESRYGLSTKTLERIIKAANVTEGIKHLQLTEYKNAVPPAGPEAEMIAGLEDRFQMLSSSRAAEPFVWQVFGLGVPMGLIKLKELEVRNLSAIAFGVEQGLGAKAVIGRLVSPS